VKVKGLQPSQEWSILVDIKEGDNVILLDDDGRKFRVRAEKGTLKVKGIGVANVGKIVGVSYGDRVTLAGRDFVALRPTVLDSIETMERKAQIIVPKDSGYIILHSGIGPGSRVVEGGSGSGALTLALAWAVAPDGKVYSYDIKEKHQTVASRNVERAGLSALVEWKRGDVSEAIEEKEIDAVILDIPEPWGAVDNAAGVLRSGGHLASYSPTANQVERMVKALRGSGFAAVTASELIHREMVVSEGGIRPSFDMLGHTGYIVVARWLGR
jgi:tRNA (adenine57-N1/adenine58-N1)-methyltransferase